MSNCINPPMARDNRPSVVPMVGRPSGMVTLTPSEAAAAAWGAAATACACGAVCVVWDSTAAILSALRLVPRLAKLLLRLPEFALEPLQFALQSANLTLDSFDPVNRSILRIGRHRHRGGTERDLWRG